MIKNIKTRIAMSLFWIFIFQVSACAEQIDSDIMQVYSYSPVNQAISTVYQISFYEDGLIKTISKYINILPKDINIDEREFINNATLSKTVEVIKQGSTISVYVSDISKGQDRVLEEVFKIVDNTNIERTLINKSMRKDQIVHADDNGSFKYYYKGDVAFLFTVLSNSAILEYPRTENVTKYNFNSSGNLQSINSRKKEFYWEGEVTMDSDNRYTLIQPSIGDPGTYLAKYIIDMPHIEFSGISSIINNLVVPSNDRIFLLPFVAKTIVH